MKKKSIYFSLSVLVLGVFTSLYLWWGSKNNQTNEIQKIFSQQAQLISLQIQREIDLGIDNLLDLKAFYDSSPTSVGPQEFQFFTKELLKHNKSIQALEWVPLIKNQDRLTFEKKQSMDFPSFQITEKSSEKQKMVPAQVRDYYLPVTYVEPHDGNGSAHGYDLFSEETRKKTLELSRDTGLSSFSPQISLAQGGHGILGVVPVYQKGKPLRTNFQRQQNFMGFVTGVYRVKTLVEQALSNLKLQKNKIELFVHDISNPELDPDLLFSTPSDSKKNAKHQEIEMTIEGIKRYEGFLQVPGRHWQLVILPTPAFVQASQTNIPLRTFSISLAFSVILTTVVFLFLLTRERSRAIIKLYQELDSSNKNLEEKIELRTLELEQSNENLKQFAFIASHDLQEPLRKINSFISIIQQDLKNKLDEDSQKNMNFVINAATRMSQLIKNLLQFSQVGGEKLTLQKVNFNDLIKKVLSTLDDLIQEKRASISYHDLPTLKAVSPLIDSVFQNLITNAIIFCPNERLPKIDIFATEEAYQWTFSIKDNGIGIKKQHLNKIFELFQCLHKKENYQGTGAGLAICKKIIERHDGKIWVESIPNQGSNFFFTLPK